MAVVPLTVIVGLCLVLGFVVLFLREQARGGASCAERDSLLPLAEETPRVIRNAPAPGKHDGCGCHDGSRPACPGCLRARE